MRRRPFIFSAISPVNRGVSWPHEPHFEKKNSRLIGVSSEFTPKGLRAVSISQSAGLKVALALKGIKDGAPVACSSEPTPLAYVAECDCPVFP